MTARAVILGLTGALLIATLGYVNDSVLKLLPLVGTYFPISVFGLLIAWAFAGNPLLFLLRRRWRLQPGELAVIAAMVLAACSIPGSGLMRFFTLIQALPVHYSHTLIGWQKLQLLQYVPPALLPAGGRYDPQVMSPLMVGAVSDGRVIGLADLPWGAWQGCLSTWLAIIVLAGLATTCLALLLHRQWSSHEALRYPIALVARSVLQQDPARASGPVFRNRLFWSALAVVLAIRIVNGLKVWYPNSIEIPLRWNFAALLKIWPDMTMYPRWWLLVVPTIYPTVVAFAYFLASDVSFSLGISFPAFMLVAIPLLSHGVDLTHDFTAGGPLGWHFLGGYVGVALMIVYTGRRYYWDALRQALIGTGRGGRKVEPTAAWACRGFLACSAGAAGLLVLLGLQWPFAILTIVLVMVIYMVVARMTVESGLFWIYAGWLPTGAMIGLFGREVLGPQVIIIAGLVGSMLAVDPRESLMPFFMNGLKIAEDFGVRPARMTRWSAAGWLLALAAAVPLVLWANYNYGFATHIWTMEVPKRPFDTAQSVANRLTPDGRLEQVNRMSAWQRLASARPEEGFLPWAGSGLVLVLLFSALRLRFRWWPLHPILFLVWGEWPVGNFGFSFLLGWLIKTVVARLGGGRLYEKLKPFMIGAVAGDMLGALSFMVVGAVSYALTGTPPKSYRIFP